MRTPESIYRQFVNFEERAASIYMQLASRFSRDSQLSSFWLEMAMQEKQHAGLLQFCLCESLFARDLPDSHTIDELVRFFDNLERRAADANLTTAQAFELAVAMETSEINSIYCHLTTTVHTSMYLLRRKIATSLPNHVEELIAAARKFGVEENTLQDLIRVNERCSGHWRSVG